MARHKTGFFALVFSRLLQSNLVKDTLLAKSEGLTLYPAGNTSCCRGDVHSCLYLTLEHTVLPFHMSLLMKGFGAL